MNKNWIWSIGSEHLVDNYKDPGRFGAYVWDAEAGGTREFPMFHPSESDPDAGYKLYPYTIRFRLDEQPAGSYVLQIDYLVIAPRAAYLELKMNGTSGHVYLQPEPSKSGEIRLLSGLHTTIYSDGKLEVAIPGQYLVKGMNELVLISRDGGDTMIIDNIEKIRRLDRMANGAGLLYEGLRFGRADAVDFPGNGIRRFDIRPTVMYRRSDSGELVEHCRVHIEAAGKVDAASLMLKLESGGRTEQIPLVLSDAAFGHLMAEFEVFDGNDPVSYTVEGIVNGSTYRAEGAFFRRRKWKVYVTSHAHTDIGYTHRQWEVAERLCRNIDKALELLDEEERGVRAGLDSIDGTAGGSGKHFSFHMDATWSLETFLETRSAERVEMFWRRVREGRFNVVCNYADLLTQLATLEDLIRNNEYTESVMRPHGLRADLMAVVDVASITGSMPAVLEGSGVKYLVHANNQDRGPFRLNGGLHKVSPFYWEGVNGGQVLCWLAKMYCELRKVCGSPPVLSSAERGLEMWLQEYETDAYAPDAVLLYGQEADNTDIDPQPMEFVRQWNGKYAYPELIAADISEFFRYVEDRFGSSLARIKGDSGAYWEDGAISSVEETIKVREAQTMLPAAEKLETLAAIHNPGWAVPIGQFEEAFKQELLYVEHTWGAFLSCTEPDALLAEDQWAVKKHMADQASAWGKRLLHVAAIRNSLCWNNSGREVVVYNPHSWKVSGPAVVEIGRREVVLDPFTDGMIPMRVLKELSTQRLVELWVEGLEGLSYKRFVLQEQGAADSAGAIAGPAGTEIQEVSGDGIVAADTGAGVYDGRVSYGESGTNGVHGTHGFAAADTTADARGTAAVCGGAAAMKPTVLENRYYRIVFDSDSGGITGLFDKELAKELVEAAAEQPGQEYDDSTSIGAGFGKLLYARGGEGTRLMGNQSDLAEGNPEVLGDFEIVELEQVRFAYGSALRVKAMVPYGQLELEWKLYDTEKRVDVEFLYHKEERREKEAVYVAFPTSLQDAEVLSDSQLGWINWDKDQLPGGCKEWLPLQSGILIRGGDAEVLIASPDIPLFCVGDIVRGRWPKELDLTGGRVYSYVMTNYWHTNYKASQGGPIRFRYSLTSGRQVPKDAAYRFGAVVRQPLYAHRISFQDFREHVPAVYGEPSGGTLAAVGSEQVVASALKPAKYADGIVLRLQDIAGSGGQAPVRFPGKRIVRAWATDLLEKETAQLVPSTDGGLTVNVPAWGLATVRLELANA